MRYEVLIGPPYGTPGYGSGDNTVTVYADGELSDTDAACQAGITLAQGRPASQIRGWRVKSVRCETEAARLAQEPAGVRAVVTGREAS
jgi:hypothetical protein